MTEASSTDRSSDRTAARGPGWRACLGTGAGAFAIVLAWLWLLPDLAPWGDALRFVVEADAIDGYSLFGNHVGQRIGLHLAVPLGDALGLSGEASARWLSMLGMAGGLGLAAATARSLGASATACVGWAAVLGASPSVALLGTITEVHGVQLFASALALALLVATRDAGGPTRWGVALLALALATIGHTSQIVLAAPIFAFVALRRGRPAQVALAAVLCAALVGAIGWTAMGFFERVGPDGYEGTWRPLYVLGRYSSIVLEMRARSGWFGPLAMVEFTWTEVVLTGGAAWVALFGLRAARSGADSDAGGNADGDAGGGSHDTGARAWLAVPIGLVAYLAVLSQVGIHERGAYFLALFPWLVAVGARLPKLVPFALLLVQVPLGLAAVFHDAERADPRDWQAGLVAALEEGELSLPLTLYTSDMVRHSAIGFQQARTDPDAVVVADMWYFRFEWVPERAWDAVLGPEKDAAFEQDFARGRVFLDAQCLPDEDGDGAPWQRWTAAYLERGGYTLRPIPWPASADEPPSDALERGFLYEVVR